MTGRGDPRDPFPPLARTAPPRRVNATDIDLAQSFVFRGGFAVVSEAFLARAIIDAAQSHLPMRETDDPDWPLKAGVLDVNAGQIRLTWSDSTSGVEVVTVAILIDQDGTVSFPNGIGAAWTAWTPTTDGITVGTGGTTVAEYRRLGDTHIEFFYEATLAGSDFAIATPATITLPVTADTRDVETQIGQATLVDEGTVAFPAVTRLASTTLARPMAMQVSGSNVIWVGVTNLVPHTWAATDRLIMNGVYKAAAA